MVARGFRENRKILFGTSRPRAHGVSQQSGIPFMAFRGKMAGSATGAHVHIGKPSFRIASP
jgi:hypothetical protein